MKNYNLLKFHLIEWLEGVEPYIICDQAVWLQVLSNGVFYFYLETPQEVGRVGFWSKGVLSPDTDINYLAEEMIKSVL